MAYTYKVSNNARTTLANSISATDTQVTVLDNTNFPTPFTVSFNGNVFYATITNAATLLTNEIVLVTNTNGSGVYTIVRNQQGTTSPAEGWPAGSLFSLLPTEGNWENYTQFGEYADIPVPVGGVIYWPSTAVVPPSEKYIMCDGRLLSKTSYSALYAAIGDLYGSNSTQFNIPNYRARFHRGASSTRPIATAYDCSIANHAHYQQETVIQGYRQNGADALRNCNYPISLPNQPSTDRGNWGDFADETRPVNMALDMYIKAV